MVFSSDYNKKWNNDYTNKEGLRDKLRDAAAQSQTPLKPRIEEAQKKLQMQIAKLEGMSSKMQEKDKVIFSRIVKAIQNHDNHYGKLLSGELSQIRKMIKMIDSAKTAFQKIESYLVLKQRTSSILNDVAKLVSYLLALELLYIILYTESSKHDS